MTLVRIVAPHFVAAVVADTVVRECAPILSYMTGWNGRQVADYCKRKGWSWDKGAVDGCANGEDGGP